MAHGSFQLEVESEMQLPAYTTAAATQDLSLWHSGSLTHWARPGIEPEISWFLVGFVSAVPQWELLRSYFNDMLLIKIF